MARKPAQTRRASGDGSVYPDGQHWRGALPIGRNLLTQRTAYQRTARFPTKAQAAAALRELRVQYAAGITQAGGKQATATWLTTWLETYKHKHVAQSTYDRYGEHVRLHLAPYVGRYALSALRPQHVQQCWNALAKTRAPQTILNAKRVLVEALNQAVAEGLIAKNPCATTSTPKVEREPVQALTHAQGRALLAAVADHPWGLLYRLALLLGLRQGELLGLRWDALDLGAGELRVQQQVRRTSAGIGPQPLKTSTSRRTLALSRDLVAQLHAHRAGQLRLRVQLGSLWTDHGLVFSTQKGTPIEPSNLGRDWRRVRDAAGLPATTRFHDLRHTAGSWLIDAGASIVEASEQLGHASPAITARVYAHSVGDRRHTIARDLAERFKATGTDDT